MVELLLKLIDFLFENQHHLGPFSANGANTLTVTASFFICAKKLGMKNEQN